MSCSFAFRVKLLTTLNQRVFRRPYPYLLSTISSWLVYFAPSVILASVFNNWPKSQAAVLHMFLSSKTSVFASLSMANEEMDLVRDLDFETLLKNKEKTWIYLAEHDDWVGDDNKKAIVKVMADEEEHLTIRLVHGERGIPHAYCISMFTH